MTTKDDGHYVHNYEEHVDGSADDPAEKEDDGDDDNEASYHSPLPPETVAIVNIERCHCWLL